MQQSLEEILRAKMAAPVNIKGKEGATVMPMEAIAMAIMNNAMRGDLAAANFIRQLTGSSRDAQHDEAQARARLMAVVAELRTALVADGLQPAEGSPELELLAVEFSTLRRIAALLMAEGHTDIVVTATKQELSTFERSRQTGSGVSLRAKRTRITRIERIMDEHTKQLITMLNDMYCSQGDEYKSRYRENYFELLRHIVSPRAYISGEEIAAQIERMQIKMNKE